MADDNKQPGAGRAAAPQVPWWQRELNAQLARQAQRRAALQRLAARCLGALVLVLLGMLLVLLMGQNTHGQLARSIAQTTGSATAGDAAHARQGATLTLSPPAAHARGRAGSTLRVTATNDAGSPLGGITIWLTINGLVPYNGAATTDATGVATFNYQGDGQPYTVHITATADGRPLAVSTVQVGGRPVGTTTVTGRFYAAADRCTFTTPPNTRPLFTEQFPTVNFGGRPFTGYGATADQQSQIAARGRYTAGIGPLSHFNAAFTGTFVIQRAGDTSFTFLIDDAFNFGIGDGARRVSGTLSNPPASGLTAIERLPVVGAFNQGHLQATTHVSVQFLHPGRYAYELDYAECKLGGESLRLSTDGQFLPTVR